MTVKHLQGATGQRNLCVFFLVLFDIYLPTCSVHNILYLTYFAIFNIFFSQFEVKKQTKQKLKKQRKVNGDQLCFN